MSDQVEPLLQSQAARRKSFTEFLDAMIALQEAETASRVAVYQSNQAQIIARDKAKAVSAALDRYLEAQKAHEANL